MTTNNGVSVVLKPFLAQYLETYKIVSWSYFSHGHFFISFSWLFFIMEYCTKIASILWCSNGFSVIFFNSFQDSLLLAQFIGEKISIVLAFFLIGFQLAVLRQASFARRPTLYFSHQPQHIPSMSSCSVHRALQVDPKTW